LPEKDFDRIVSLLAYVRELNLSVRKEKLRGKRKDKLRGEVRLKFCFGRGKWSTQYYYAARSYAEKRGLIDLTDKKKIKLTAKGGKLLHSNILSKGEPKLEFMVDRGKKPGKITFEIQSDRLNKIQKLWTLIEYFRNDFSTPNRVMTPRRILGMMMPPGIGEFKIEMNVPQDEDVVSVFSLMDWFYMKVCDIPTEEILCPLLGWLVTPGMYERRDEDHWSKKYHNYWKIKLRKATRELVHSNLMKFSSLGKLEEKWENIELPQIQRLDAKKYVPDWLIEHLEKPTARKWVERRLGENPNFFMPAPFWELVGFRDQIEKMKPIKRFPSLVHPYDSRLINPAFGEYLQEMDNWFYAAKRAKKKIDAFKCIGLGLFGHFHKPGFYDAWNFLREGKIGETVPYKKNPIFRPIDEAFYRMLSGKKTHLYEVYSDLGLGRLDLKSVIERIRQGGYDYTLYTPPDKFAWPDESWP